MIGLPALSAPEHLTADHDIADFDSGEPSLDNWLKRHALANEGLGASRTYVVCAEGGRVAGFYALATGAVMREHAPRAIARRMPDPIPVMLLARLAVDRNLQRGGIGSGLLKSAVLQTLSVASIAGVRAMLIHALSDDAKRFYMRYGFVESPTESLTLMATLAQLAATLHEL